MKFNSAMDRAGGDIHRLVWAGDSGYRVNAPTVSVRAQARPSGPQPDPDSWYSPQDVFREFGWPECRQEEARANGRLIFVGEGPSVRCSGDALAIWFDAGCPYEPLPVVECSATTSDTRNEREVMPAYIDAKTTLRERVDAAVAKGKPRHVASREALQRDPQLRKDLLTQANAGRPHALAAIDRLT